MFEATEKALAKFKAAIDAVRNSKKTPEQIEKAKELYDSLDPGDRALLEYIFPEVVESEDERIRKKLVEYISDWKEGQMRWNSDKEFCSRALTYLEKQKEQKPIFRVGDAMRTISEAAKGIKDGLPYVVSIDSEYYNCNNEKIRIEDQGDYEFPPMNRKQPAEWSEEDESKRSITISFLTTFAGMTDRLNDDGLISSPALQGCVDWLKSLRSRPKSSGNWKPSEGQMAMLRAVLNEPKNAMAESAKIALESLYNELKKL